MKRITLLLMATFLISGFTVYSQKVMPGAVVGLANVTALNDEISNERLEDFYKEEFIPAFNREAPSIPICLMKKIAGKRMDEYAEFYVFESLKARDEWFPEPGGSSEKAKTFFNNLGETWTDLWKVISSVGYTDYLVLPFEGKSIELKPGAVIVVFECEITPEKGMSIADFEKFYLEKYSPAYEKHFKGVEFCVLKGERGERTGKYTELMIVDSMDDYKQWVTEKGGSSEKMKKAYADMGEIQQRMEKMYSWSRSSAYIVL